jgi:hypothetical protein
MEGLLGQLALGLGGQFHLPHVVASGQIATRSRENVSVMNKKLRRSGRGRARYLVKMIFLPSGE